MAFREIPITAGEIAFSFKIDLDNTPYEFRFTHNDRLDLWTMNIADDTGEDLIVGIPVYVKERFLAQHQHDSRLPQGELFAVNLVDGITPPGKENFGTDVVLYYQDAS